MTHDLIVIGAGSAGLTAAGGTALFGLKVALIERAEMGGECLNTGCVPSKALITAAARASEARTRLRFGVTLDPPEVEWTGVRGHVEHAIATIAPHDSQETFEEMGVEVIRGEAKFLDGKTLQVGSKRLSAPRIVIATGSRPMLPPIEGLEQVPFLTNENLFKLDLLPEHLVIVGNGAIGIEMAQSFRRLGSMVTVIAPGRALGRDDEEAALLVTHALAAEGVHFAQGRAAKVVESDAGLTVLGDGFAAVTGSHLLIATGRTANVADLDLAAAGVDVGKDGIEVDARRRTSNKRIYAIGDCRSGPRFTHAAGYEGSLVALEVALGLPSKADWSALPHATYCDPELAQIGMTEQAAREKHDDITIEKLGFDHNDRAISEGDTRGFIKLVRRGRKVLGVTIVGAHAGDLLLPWAQIITGKASTFSLGSAIISYPTRSEISKAAAFAAWEPVVFGTWPKRWAKAVAKGRKWFS